MRTNTLYCCNSIPRVIFLKLSIKDVILVLVLKNIQQHSNYPWKINDSLVPEISLRNKSKPTSCLKKNLLPLESPIREKKKYVASYFSSEKCCTLDGTFQFESLTIYDELCLPTEQNAIDATYLALKYHSQNKFNLPLILKRQSPRNLLTKCKDPQLQLYLTQLYNNNQQQHILNKNIF